MMIQNVANPITALVVAFAAFVLLLGFTISRILATVPTPHMSPHATLQVISETNYSGIVSWVTKDTLAITDQFGASRVFTLDDETDIKQSSGADSEMHTLDHVRVTARGDNTEEYAVSIVNMQ